MTPSYLPLYFTQCGALVYLYLYIIAFSKDNNNCMHISIIKWFIVTRCYKFRSEKGLLNLGFIFLRSETILLFCVEQGYEKCFLTSLVGHGNPGKLICHLPDTTLRPEAILLCPGPSSLPLLRCSSPVRMHYHSVKPIYQLTEVQRLLYSHVVYSVNHWKITRLNKTHMSPNSVHALQFSICLTHYFLQVCSGLYNLITLYILKFSHWPRPY